MAGKEPGKRHTWELKGQQCDVNEELKRYREEFQKLNQENQGLLRQLKEPREQGTLLRNTLEGKLASVPSQQKLETLCAHVLELKECLKRFVQEFKKERLELQEEKKALATRLGTNERLVQQLQKEKLELQEEQEALATRLEEQEVNLVLLVLLRLIRNEAGASA